MAKARRYNFETLLALMRSRDAATAEDGFHRIRDQVSDYLPQLLSAYESEEQQPMKCWMLDLIGEARSEAAFDLLCRETGSDEESLRDWATRGLTRLDTKPARKFLFEKGLSANS